jgi:hypothetical protein
VQEAHEQAARKVGDKCGDFRQGEAQRIELRPAQARGQRREVRAERREEDRGRGVFEEAKAVDGKRAALRAFCVLVSARGAAHTWAAAQPRVTGQTAHA